jgi:hypothetical protein
MTFALPFFAWVSGAVALATVALHLLAWRRPPESPLPTARFAPERPVRMVSRAIRPADIALLAIRVSIIVLVGAALARPTFVARRAGVGRVVVVDRSRFAGDGSAVAAAARALFRDGDALVLFDSAARDVVSATADSAGAPVSSASGALSPALVRAVRAARRLERDRDSVEIVIVSPFAAPELDAATGAIRQLWPGALRLVRSGTAPNDSILAARPAIRAPAGDPLAATLTLVGDVPAGADVRVVRDALTAADSTWARDGHALVSWPDGLVPAGWGQLPASDTAFAVTVPGSGNGSPASASRSATVVAPMVRTTVPPAGRAIARWSDGEPAASEAALGAGCIRSVAVPVSRAGDLPLTPAFRRFASRLLEPCADALPWAAASDSVLAAVLPPIVTPRSGPSVAGVAGATAPSKLAAWLLGLALLAAVAEMVVRRGADANATG